MSDHLSIPSHRYSCQPKEGGTEGTYSSCPIVTLLDHDLNLFQVSITLYRIDSSLHPFLPCFILDLMVGKHFLSLFEGSTNKTSYSYPCISCRVEYVNMTTTQCTAGPEEAILATGRLNPSFDQGRLYQQLSS